MRRFAQVRKQGNALAAAGMDQERKEEDEGRWWWWWWWRLSLLVKIEGDPLYTQHAQHPCSL